MQADIPPPLPPPPSQTAAKPRGQALAVASLILGIVAIVTSPLLIGSLLGLVGLVLGTIHLIRPKSPKATASAGVLLSLLSIVTSAVLGVVYYNYAMDTWQKTRSELGIGGNAGGFMDLVREAKKGLDHFERTIEEAESGEYSTWKGVLAPDMEVYAIDGQKIKISSLKGRRVAIIMWSTTSVPSVNEIPHLIQLTKEIPPERLLIIAISPEQSESLRLFAAGRNINYPIVAARPTVSPYADSAERPTTFVIDQEGRIERVLVGYHDYSQLKRAFEGQPMLKLPNIE